MTPTAFNEEREGHIYWGSKIYKAEDYNSISNQSYIEHKGKWYIPSHNHVIEVIRGQSYIHFYLAEVYRINITDDNFLEIDHAGGFESWNLRYKNLTQTEMKMLNDLKQ